jgi:hypothetical protein
MEVEDMILQRVLDVLFPREECGKNDAPKYDA